MELAPISFFSVRIQSALVHGVAEYPNKHFPCGRSAPHRVSLYQSLVSRMEPELNEALCGGRIRVLLSRRAISLPAVGMQIMEKKAS